MSIFSATTVITTNYADHHAADHYGGGASLHHDPQGPLILPPGVPHGHALSMSGHAPAHGSSHPHAVLSYPSPSSTPLHGLPNSHQLSHQVMKQ